MVLLFKPNPRRTDQTSPGLMWSSELWSVNYTAHTESHPQRDGDSWSRRIWKSMNLVMQRNPMQIHGIELVQSETASHARNVEEEEDV